MNARLERRLGLYSVFTVSVGAMIGSGIFVLPGLAYEVGGPSVILAYALAGLVVLPAALAQSEMATVMPRAGGAYLYIDLAMGPMMGTIAGIGVWFSLVFKSAFALEGLGLYLRLFTDLDAIAMGLVIGAGLLVLNLAGVRQSGTIQAVLVTLVFAILVVFIGGGATLVESDFFHPFWRGGVGGLLETAAIVFVSYAGVTKVASVAEEVARPAQALPLAILSSLLVMMVVYPTVTYVMIGVVPPGVFGGDVTPLATATGQFFPEWVVTVVAVTGVLALTSMANAGLLASSRYPFAMARRRLVPQMLTRVGGRSGAPNWSLLLTGGVLLGLVAFLPIFELAKLASAFQLLVLAMINVAQLAFRRSNLWWYRPKFTAPGYPWVPILGVVTCLLLITQLGIDALLGAAGIIIAGLAFYRLYGRSRAIKENAFRESVRQQGMARVLRLTEAALNDHGRRVGVISGGKSSDGSLARIGRSLAGSNGGMGLVGADESPVGRDGEVEVDLIVAGLDVATMRRREDLPEDRDVVAFSGDDLGSIERIAVLGSGGPYDVLKISVAAKLAGESGASIRFVHVLDPRATRAQVRSLEQFHGEVGALCDVPTESTVVQSEDLMGALTSSVGDADLAIVGAPRRRPFSDEGIHRIISRIAPPVLVVRVADKDEPASLRRFFDRVVMWRLAGSDAEQANE